MARRRREQLRAEWIDRLRRFQKRSGNVEEFCRAKGGSLAMLYRWRQRPAGAVRGRVPARGVSGHPKTGRAGAPPCQRAPQKLPGDCQPWMISDPERGQFTADICPQATSPQIPSDPDGSIPNRDAS